MKFDQELKRKWLFFGVKCKFRKSTILASFFYKASYFYQDIK